MRTLLVVVFLLASAVPLAAKPKTKTYKAKPKAVFDAALLVAWEQYVVREIGEKHLAFMFASGASLTSYGFNCNVLVEPDGTGKAKLILNVQKKLAGCYGVSFAWGAGGRLAGQEILQAGGRAAEKGRAGEGREVNFRQDEQ